MKVVDNKKKFRVLIVICIIGFCSAPCLMGACNYPSKNYTNIELDLTGGNVGCGVGDSRTFSVSFDIPGTDSGQGAALMDIIEDIVPSAFEWEYNNAHWKLREKVYNRMKLRATAVGEDIVTSVKIREGAGFTGVCQASYETDIYARNLTTFRISSHFVPLRPSD